jgi:tRNA A-37 threonylcarbamoyl transferase component Bud32
MSPRSRFDEALARLAKESVTLFGISDPNLSVFGQAEGRTSRVLHVQIDGGNRAVQVSLKVYTEKSLLSLTEKDGTPSAAQTEFERTLISFEATRHAEHCGAVRPITYFSDLNALVTEHVAGPPLSEVLRRMAWKPQLFWKGLNGQTAFRRAGEWLSLLQGAPCTGSVSVGEVVSGIEHRVRALEEARHLDVSAVGLSSIHRRVAGLATEVERFSQRAVLIHGDYCPENIIVLPERVMVLDHSTAQAGFRHYDLAHLYLHIEFKRGLTRAARRDAQAALLAGFGTDRTVLREPSFCLAMIENLCSRLLQPEPKGTARRFSWLRLQRDRWRCLLALAAERGSLAHHRPS